MSILDYNKLEDKRKRGEAIVHKFYIQYPRVYNIPVNNLFNDATKTPKKGDAQSGLSGPLFFSAAGVQIPRVLNMQIQRQADKQNKVQVNVDWYQVRLYAGENTTSPSELIFSREGKDDGYHKTFVRYYVSTGGSSGISDGTLYPSDTDINDRWKISETIDTTTLPGMFFHEVTYLGYKAYA